MQTTAHEPVDTEIRDEKSLHGPDQEGLVGPSLVQSLKVMTKDEFKAAVLDGRVEKGMPGFSAVQTVVDNIDNLYAYLKGRSDGAIKPGKLKGIE